MNYCPNCGRHLEETDEYCPECGAKLKATEAPVSLKKDENAEGGAAGGSRTQAPGQNEPPRQPAGESGFKHPEGFQRNPEEPFSNGLKVLFVAVNLLVPVIGFIFGIISAIIFMRKKNTDYKSFGKALLVLNIILLALFLFCCVFSGLPAGFLRGFSESLREYGYDIGDYDEFYHDYYYDGSYKIF